MAKISKLLTMALDFPGGPVMLEIVEETFARRCGAHLQQTVSIE